MARVRAVMAALDQVGIDIERIELNVDKHRLCATIEDRVRCRDEGMANGHDLITRTNIRCQEGKMRGRCPTTDSRRVPGRRRQVAKLRFEGFNFRTLRHPARWMALSRRGFLLA